MKYYGPLSFLKYQVLIFQTKPSANTFNIILRNYRSKDLHVQINFVCYHLKVFQIARFVSRVPVPQNKPAMVSFLNAISLFVIYFKVLPLESTFCDNYFILFSFILEWFICPMEQINW